MKYQTLGFNFANFIYRNSKQQLQRPYETDHTHNTPMPHDIVTHSLINLSNINNSNYSIYRLPITRLQILSDPVSNQDIRN
jgi:hypothetical protein